MKILILGHSNSISPNGYIRGLTDQLGGPTVVNYSVGYSPGTQFAYYGGLDFSAYDLVIVDSLANDDMYLEAVGGWEFYRDLYYELFSTIASQTRLVVVGFFRRPLEAPVTDAFYLQVDLAALFGAIFVDVREFVLAHGPSLIPEGARLMLDEAHPHDTITRAIGRHIGKMVTETPAPPKARENFAANFHGIEAAEIFSGGAVVRQTRLMTRRLAVLREGDAIGLDREWPVVGFFVDITMTKGFLALEGSQPALAKPMVFHDPVERLQMRFVPRRSRSPVRRLVCTGPRDIYEPTLFSLDPRPEYGSPVISLHGIACWSGGSHDDLPIKRRGAIGYQPTRRALRATEDIELGAPDMPVGHGWRAPGQRPDGVFSRATGPDTPSILAFDFEPGRYVIELRVFGAVTAETLETLQISAAGRPLTVKTAFDPAAGLFRCSMDLKVERGGPIDLLLSVPLTKNGYGLEVAGLRVMGMLAFA